jgi:hypothetical protein
MLRSVGAQPRGDYPLAFDQEGNVFSEIIYGHKMAAKLSTRRQDQETEQAY